MCYWYATSDKLKISDFVIYIRGIYSNNAGHMKLAETWLPTQILSVSTEGI